MKKFLLALIVLAVLFLLVKPAPAQAAFNRCGRSVGSTSGCTCECPRGSVIETNTCSQSGGSCGGSCVCRSNSGFNLGFITLSPDPKVLAGQILEFGYGIGTLFAILFIAIGGYEVATSAGDPERLEAAKARITASIMGLVFLFASALILRTLGCGLINIQSDIICG